MNITELARKLRTTTSELFEHLPQMGFDIGRRAIKVDDRVAQRIMKSWGGYRARLEEQRKREQELKQIEEIKQHGPVKIPATMTVKEFAGHLNLPVNKILAELMKNGIVTSLNERLDFDTASILAEDMGLEVVLDESETAEEIKTESKIQDIISGEKDDALSQRPPVVVIMGHVDHGKTKLLDAIRDTHIIEGESGGITQHIGAYQAWANPKGDKSKKEVITFVDTPGHEAFTAMRSRGAKIADIAILVVAADDGVMPQTVEAYKIIEQAKIPVIVAINKIDKPDANIEKVKQDLSSKLNLLPEDWGGKTICVPISAKQNTNIDQLLEMILLVKDLEQDNIKANPNTTAAGTVIEAHLDTGEGPVATVLVQNGTLKVGEYIIIDDTVYGKIKAMKDFHGDSIKEAIPSMPVKILGLKISPKVGDIIESTKDAKMTSKQLKRKKFSQSSIVASGMISIKTEKKEEDTEAQDKQINIILKADVLGSLEAIIESIQKIEHPEVKINILSKGLGAINEVDVLRAEPSKAMIAGFHVVPTSQAKMFADDKKIIIKNYKIIYELLEDIKILIESKLSPEIIRKDLGKLEVLAIFNQGKDGKGQIVGGKVTEGLIKKDAIVDIFKNGEFFGKAKLNEIRGGKEEISEVDEGQECGLNIDFRDQIEVGDVVEFYQEEKKAVKL